MDVQRGDPPRVHVEPLTCAPTAAPDRWRCAWYVTNLGPRVLHIDAAWAPHGRFRAAEWAYAPALAIDPSERVRLEETVAAVGTPGEVVENAFLILRGRWGEAPWRVLARLTISFDADARPVQSLALLTTQPIGFAL